MYIREEEAVLNILASLVACITRPALRNVRTLVVHTGYTRKGSHDSVHNILI